MMLTRLTDIIIIMIIEILFTHGMVPALSRIMVLSLETILLDVSIFTKIILLWRWPSNTVYHHNYVYMKYKFKKMQVMKGMLSMQTDTAAHW